MAWMRIDDRVRTHPKIVKAGPAPGWFWFCGICYCREHLTDGFIPTEMLASLCPGVGIGSARRHTQVLVRVKLWHETDGGYQVHDFLDWNPSRAEVVAKREKDSERKKDGFRMEIAVDSERKNNGVQTDSEASRVGAYGSGSLGNLGSSSFGESREPFAHRAALVVSPAEFHRKHVAIHVTEFCDWVCFPNELAREFAQKVTGTPHEEAFTQVLDWAREIRRQWQGRVVPDGSPWDFWKHRWTETHGGSKPHTGPTGDGLDGLRSVVKHG